MAVKSNKRFIHLVLIAGSIVMLLPFAWMLLTSFKTMAESMAFPPTILPDRWMFTNYVDVMFNENTFFALNYLNTIIVTVCRTVGQLLLCSLAAYAIATLYFPGKNVIFLLILSVMMIPNQIVIIPTYILMRDLDWLDTYQALIIPGIASAFGVFLLRQFFMSVPHEINEAARMDGCSLFRIYWKIYIPLSGPALVSLSIFVIMAAWNDFLAPLVLTNSSEMYVLSIAIANFVGEYETNYPQMMAAATLSVIPLIAAFVILQRYFVEGISMTGVKG
ncbi:carbohydrate ABC transporter permease [Paenibacillus chungangensis]|uniref:Carbohydrate ABC transporter permease n=1 Tax=Paenibacillus chungangensis TaxID=696535 RepID=A0ABW3HQD7_9BACL